MKMLGVKVPLPVHVKVHRIARDAGTTISELVRIYLTQLTSRHERQKEK